MTGDNDTITLRDAAAHFGFGLWTLRAEARRGNLTIYKIGREYRTTPAAIREMVAKCLVEVSVPDFTATRNAAVNTSSATVAASLDSATEAMLKLRKPLPHTSRQSTVQSPAKARS
jgi:hypothetical protein